jgi:hypothetical protein
MQVLVDVESVFPLPAKKGSHRSGRRCAETSCGALLSRYNHDVICNACLIRLNNSICEADEKKLSRYLLKRRSV